MNPLTILREAIKAVPAIKYALGVGGIASAATIIMTLVTDWRIALVGTIVMLIFMGVLVVFARVTGLPDKRMHLPAMVFTWSVLLTFIFTAFFLFTSTFFNWPISLNWLETNGQSKNSQSNQKSKIAKLVETINNSDTDKEKATTLLNFSSKHNLSLLIADKLIKSDPEREFHAYLLGETALIKVTGLETNYLVFIDMKTATIALQDNEFMSGIVGLRIIGPSLATKPNTIIEAQYNTIHGTGTYGTSVKLYTITNDRVLLSLVKPSFEMNSGWGAFESDTVEFKTKNNFQINPKSTAYEIRTIGIATMKKDKHSRSKKPILAPDGSKFTAVKNLPDEFYVWNPLSMQFEQKEGRVVAGQELMTSVYSDYADPKGNWFTRPAELQKTSNLDRLYPEDEGISRNPQD